MEQKTILITGATSGMGKYMATELVRQGATVLLHGRDARLLAQTVADFRLPAANTQVRTYQADLSSLKEVNTLAETIMRREPRLDVLINNAGVGGGRPFAGRELSQDGYELRLAVNYLAPYMLTRRLLPLLKRSTPARIVNVASAGQQPLDLNNVMLEQGYSAARAYMQSKLALIMSMFDLADDLKGSGVTCNALHPATFMNTKMVRQSLIPPMSSVKSGAEPTLYLATSPEVQDVTGAYYDQYHKSRAAAQAYDMQTRAQLKTITEDLLARALA